MRVRTFVLGWAVLGTLACGPSIKPQMKSATDERIAALKGGALVPAPASYKPQDWAVGQWIAYRVTEKDKPPSFSRLKVVSKDAEGIWLETEQQDYYGHQTSKVLYSRMPFTAAQAVDAMMKVVTKKDDEPEQVMDFGPSNPMAGFIKATMKQFAVNVVAPTDVSNEPKEDVTVAAGTFRGAAKFQSTISFGPIEKRVTGWFHPAIPLNGGVKSVTEDGDITYELLGYGTK